VGIVLVIAYIPSVMPRTGITSAIILWNRVVLLWILVYECYLYLDIKCKWCSLRTLPSLCGFTKNMLTFSWHSPSHCRHDRNVCSSIFFFVPQFWQIGAVSSNVMLPGNWLTKVNWEQQQQQQQPFNGPLSGWSGTRRIIHLFTPLLIINHPLSVSSIYYNP